MPSTLFKKKRLRLDFAPEVSKATYLTSEASPQLRYHALLVNEVFRTKGPRKILRLVYQHRRQLFDPSLPVTGNFKDVMERLTTFVVFQIEQLTPEYRKKQAGGIRQLLAAGRKFWGTKDARMRDLLKRKDL